MLLKFNNLFKNKMGGLLSSTPTNNAIEGTMVRRNITGTTPMSLVDNWREEVIQRVSKFQNPQKRQSNYERNISVYESVRKEFAKKHQKSYYQLFIDRFSR